MTTKSVNKLNIEKWIALGNSIPICINVGCNIPVSVRHWTTQGDPSLKTECGRCSNFRKKKRNISGIIFHKKDFCENKEGILGFVCPMDPSRYLEFPCDIYHMDHLDGNHHNNTIENVKTFCSICHTRKGKENGDFNGFKQSSRIHK
jgi:5-methylcytosine-specific restriction endonuclease McrA